ncbi:oxidative stress defense protein [Klebsiella pneumoniae]|uniref:Oxidative stress defense protein n=1 Tax=Klebsiella pneumoniae TaxID=573 RepID=A0A378A8A3_KLEPN|nr:oxidative stress defense protein [Klebsiella pneumoniae]
MKLKVLALAATLGLTTMAAQASELPDGPHIVTSGTASVAAVPDIATLAIEVNVSAKDAASAKKQADDRVAQYLSFLEKSGIAKKDINSANLRTPTRLRLSEREKHSERLSRGAHSGSDLAPAG